MSTNLQFIKEENITSASANIQFEIFLIQQNTINIALSILVFIKQLCLIVH